MLTVADDGRGMSCELQDRAFDPFFTTKPVGVGTGLGLAMCTSIVRRAGGFISVDSAPGEGATLRVYLPLASPRGVAAPAAAGRSRPIPAGVAGRTVAPQRVLVVEHDEPTRYFVARVLAGEGLEVIEANGLARAREALAGGAVDLLLTGRALPDGDGLNLAREAREQRRARRVVVVSSEPGGEVIAHGVDAVLARPLRVEGFLEIVLGLLAQVGPSRLYPTT